MRTQFTSGKNLLWKFNRTPQQDLTIKNLNDYRDYIAAQETLHARFSWHITGTFSELVDRFTAELLEHGYRKRDARKRAERMIKNNMLKRTSIIVTK